MKTADHISGKIPYVSSSAINNGVDDFIGNDNRVRTFSNCLTIANSGSVGEAFFHPYNFIASDHVTALQSNKLNEYSYLFLSILLSRFCEKYSFNREINDKRIHNEKIILPVDGNNLPDWKYMEDYAKQIYLKLRLDYLNKKIKKQET